ncbi:hypothetical protein Tco_0265755 [Tanacetum coccineum]
MPCSCDRMGMWDRRENVNHCICNEMVRLLAGLITTWDLFEKALIRQYCPPFKTAKKLEIISNFKQELDETLYHAWERYNDLLFKCPQHDLNYQQKVHIFYTRLDFPTYRVLDSKGFIPLMTQTQALISIQVMAEHSHNWYDEATTKEQINDSPNNDDTKKPKENIHAIQTSFKNCKGAHLTMEYPLEKKTRQLSKASEKVKERTTMGKEYVKEPVPRNLPAQFLGNPYRTRKTICAIRIPKEIKEDEWDMNDGCDITVKDVERLRKILTPPIYALTNLKPIVQPYMPRGLVYNKEKVVKEEEHDYDIPLYEHIMQPLTPQTGNVGSQRKCNHSIVNEMVRFWKMQIEDYLYQKKVHEPLAKSIPVGIKAEDWTLLDRQVVGVVRLSLANNIAYNVIKEKSTHGLIKALSNMYEKPSASKKVFLIRQLVNTKMEEGAFVADHVNKFNSILSTLVSVEIKFDDEVQLDEEGYHIGFRDQQWKVTKGSLVVARGNKCGSLYMVEADPATMLPLSMTVEGRSRRNIRDVIKQRVQKLRRILDGAFGGVGDEEVVVGEGLEEEALVEFMVEWFEEDEDGKNNGKEDLFNLKA